MRQFYVILFMAVIAFLRCDMPEEEPAIDFKAREKHLHCIPLRQYASLQIDTTGEHTISYYSIIQDTITKEYFEEHVRSFTPQQQVFILGYVELSDFSKAGRGIYYDDPNSGPKLFQYDGARIVKRLTKGDSPWIIAEDLKNPSLVDQISWGQMIRGTDFIIDIDILAAAPHWGQSFDFPGKEYRITGQEVRRVAVKGADDIEKGQQANELFVRQHAVLKEKEPGRSEVALYNVFSDTVANTERMHHLGSFTPDHQVYILGHEHIVSEMKAMGTGLYYHDPDSGPVLLDYFGARIIKRIAKGDSYWRIAKELGNLSLVDKLGTGMIHPGDTLTVDFDILEAVGWSKQTFNLPSDHYRIIGRKVPTVILKTP